MGVAPAWNKVIEMTPVNILSDAIVCLSLTEDSNGKYYNMCNPHSITWQTYINYINRFGYKVKIVSFDQWRNDYVMQLNKNSALYPLKTFYMNEISQDINLVENSNTQKVLLKNGIMYPKQYVKLLIYISRD